jgi:hypothetical protein
MAKREHVKILKQGVKTWNQWRKNNPDIVPDLRATILKESNLSNANFSAAKLDGAILILANLSHANLREAELRSVNLTSANLSQADLSEAHLIATNFHNAKLDETDFSEAAIGGCTFGYNDLKTAKGLDTARHLGPSIIGIDTLYLSAGNIPNSFLQGCGVPDDFITFIPSHFGLPQAIQFYSCFISYSTLDEEFARRLYSRMRDENLRVWFAPEDIKGGQKLNEQIERAIQIHDRLLLILSENSMQSEWVMTEIRNARRIEVEENRRKLFPIRLTSFDMIRQWKCFDSDSGKDLAIELREYFIPDFSD